MLARISDELHRVHVCLEESERKAKDPKLPPKLRADYARMAENWRKLAYTYELAGKISDFLEWQARRLK